MLLRVVLLRSVKLLSVHVYNLLLRLCVVFCVRFTEYIYLSIILVFWGGGGGNIYNGSRGVSN